MMGNLASAAERIASIYRPASDTAPRKLLLVDDEQSIRLPVGKFLRSRGYELSVAASGGEAREALLRQRFDAMVCDVRMPEMTGIEIVPSALEASPDIAIVMVTAVNNAPTATEALALVALEYLIKPIELSELAAAIERALQKREADARQRNVEFLIGEEFTTRSGQMYHAQELLAEAFSLALGDPPAEAAVEKLRAVATSRLTSTDLDVILRILANRKSLPQRDESRCAGTGRPPTGRPPNTLDSDDPSLPVHFLPCGPVGVLDG
jgi:DNA-binding response OmpR family regulator